MVSRHHHIPPIPTLIRLGFFLTFPNGDNHLRALPSHEVLLHELRIGGADLIVVAVVLGDAVHTALHSVAYSFALDIPSRFQTPG